MRLTERSKGPLLRRWIINTSVITLLLCVASVAQAREFSIQVKEAVVRVAPTPFARISGRLGYGTRVNAGKESGPWREIRATKGTVAGWVHETVLTPKKIALTGGQTDAQAAASGEEIALAGKGFNSDVEKEYKKNSKLDFSQIDRMERVVISDQAKIQFLRAGGLNLE